MEAPLKKVLRMFRSESLSRLTTLKFIVISNESCGDLDPSLHKPYCYSILRTITTSLLYLENFDTEMYIEEDWCKMFAKWRSLKSLHLKYYGTELERRDDGDHERRVQLRDCIRKVFDGLEEKPVIFVTGSCL
jgi:hypothetical protein